MPESGGQKSTQQVTVIDIKMPFFSMVVFMVKWAFAAIPAIILIATVIMFLISFLGSVGMMKSSYGNYTDIAKSARQSLPAASYDSPPLPTPSESKPSKLSPHAAEKSCKEYVERTLKHPANGYEFENHWDEKTIKGWAVFADEQNIIPFTCYMEKAGSGWKVSAASIE